VTGNGAGARGAGPILRAERLCREVAGRRLVDDVSFPVDAGEVLAVVGPSGAGKSSLLRLLDRLDEPTGGTVYLHGVDYRALPPRELRRRVGMVMQSAALFPGTVAGNVRFGPRQRGVELPGDQVAGILRQVGLPGFSARPVEQLSGGEAQRVSIARALANEPDVLLLDEPTSALDEGSKLGIEQLVTAVARERSLTCVIVTHDMAQAARIASRALVMEAARMRRMGPVPEVLRAEAAVS